MSDIVQENSGQKCCNHIIGEDDTSNSKYCFVMKIQNIEGASSRAGKVAKGGQGREVLRRFPSKAKFYKVGACTREFRFPIDCRVYILSPSYHIAYPSTSSVTISPQHLESGFMFPLMPYLLNLLNELKLTLFQLIPNSYTQFTSLAILFLWNKLSPYLWSLSNSFFFLLKVPRTNCTTW